MILANHFYLQVDHAGYDNTLQRIICNMRQTHAPTKKPKCEIRYL